MNLTDSQRIAPGTESGSSKKRKLHPEASDSETNNPSGHSSPIPMNLTELTHPLAEPEMPSNVKTPPPTMDLTNPGQKADSEASEAQPNTPKACSASTPPGLVESTGPHQRKSEASTKIPSAKSLHDLIIGKTFFENGDFYLDASHCTPDDDIMYYGTVRKEHPTFSDFRDSMERVPDEDIYPLVPTDMQYKIAPDNLVKSSVFIKQLGNHMIAYEEIKGNGSKTIPKMVLSELHSLERISQSPHPHLVHYYGCRIRRGHITALVFEKLHDTLLFYADTPEFQHLDKKKFIEALESAIDHLHSLGLAHNDLNPTNIMVRDGLPVLIDFGSAGPFGKHLISQGTPGWYAESFSTSEKKHDIECLAKMREWIEDPKLFDVFGGMSCPDGYEPDFRND